MTEEFYPEVEGIDINELKNELIEMKKSILEDEENELTKLLIETIDLITEEIDQRAKSASQPSYRDEVKFMAYVHFYEELMFEYTEGEMLDEDFEDEDFEDEDLEEEK